MKQSPDFYGVKSTESMHWLAARENECAWVHGLPHYFFYPIQPGIIKK